jgi:ribosome-associated toxin RatA of RatAB toxin-antitoxin module
MIKSKIIDGPFKGSVIQVVFNELDEETIVSCEFELKIALKYKILTNIIKTKYKAILTSLLYKMNNLAMNE